MLEWLAMENATHGAEMTGASLEWLLALPRMFLPRWTFSEAGTCER